MRGGSALSGDCSALHTDTPADDVEDVWVSRCTGAHLSGRGSVAVAWPTPVGEALDLPGEVAGREPGGMPAEGFEHRLVEGLSVDHCSDRMPRAYGVGGH